MDFYELTEEDIEQRESENSSLDCLMNSRGMSPEQQEFASIARDFELDDQYSDNDSFLDASNDAFSKGMAISGDGFVVDDQDIQPDFFD